MESSMTAALLAGETVIDRPIISHHVARRESSVPGKLPTTGRQKNRDFALLAARPRASFSGKSTTVRARWHLVTASLPLGLFRRAMGRPGIGQSKIREVIDELDAE